MSNLKYSSLTWHRVGVSSANLQKLANQRRCSGSPSLDKASAKLFSVVGIHSDVVRKFLLICWVASHLEIRRRISHRDLPFVRSQ